MKPEAATILITGAAGGIGSCTARRLGAAGASLLLTDLRQEPLDALAEELARDNIAVTTVAADISQPDDRQRLAQAAAAAGVNVLINIAGINPFGLFAEQTDAAIAKAIEINTLGPILLCHALLPALKQRPAAHIVNVGSVFGSLGYPGFAIYSASKFAVRGFTEALRRELAKTSVRLHYVAPRATGTALSTDRVRAMNKALKVAMDPPETVAAAIEKTLLRSRRELYLGRPERLFSLINAIVPGLVDRVLRKQLPIIERYASSQPTGSTGVESHSAEMKILGA